MEAPITNQAELRARGFRALVDALGWVNAVQFLHQFDPGSGDYTEERRLFLAERDAATLVRRIKEHQEHPGKGA